MSHATTIVSEQRLLSAGWVTESQLASGAAIAYLSSDFPKGYREATSDRMKGELVPLTTTHLEEVRATPLKYAPSCTVDGVEVDELAVLVKPVAFLVTTEHGVHEVTRCYFQKGKFQFGVDLARLGGLGAKSVEYRPEHGLLIHFDHGYEMFVPVSHCQATWRLPV